MPSTASPIKLSQPLLTATVNKTNSNTKNHLDTSNYVTVLKRHDLPLNHTSIPQKSTTITVMLKNCHGFTTRPENWHSLFTNLVEHKIDIACLVETNTAWEPSTLEYFKRTAKKYLNRPTISTAHSKIHTTTRYQPGGCATITSGLSPRLIGHITDPTGMGRWSGVILRAKEATKIAVISSYRTPGINHIPNGERTTYTQQKTILLEAGRNDIEPREAHLNDLSALIKELQKQQTEIILGIDANEALADDGPLEEFKNQHSLVNAHTNTTADNINSYIRGKTKIDYILLSVALSTCIDQSKTLDFHSIIESDHRTLTVTFNTAQLFNKWKRIEHPTRLLYSNNIKNRDQYLHNLAQYIRRRYPTIDTTLLNERNINNIDTDITQKQLAIEKAIKPLRSAWSPTIANAANIARYWRAAYHHRKNKIKQQSLLDRIRQQIPASSHPALEKTKTTRSHLRHATKHLRTMQEQATDLRQKFLKELAQRNILDNRRTEATEIKSLTQAEAQRNTFRLIKLMNNAQKQPLNHIIIDKTTIIQNLDQMETRINEQNIRHFSQANNTPFASTKAKEIFGTNGTNDQAESVYRGNKDTLKHFDGAAKTILNRLTKQRLPTFHANIDKTTIRNTFNHWRETTATSPSGKHLGHYRAITREKPPQEDPANENTTPQIDANFLLNIIERTLNIAITAGQPLLRWLNAVSLMLEKIEGLPHIDKLRIIHLFEADYGLLGKEIWANKMMRHAEHHGVITDTQYGARKGRQTHDILLTKHLLYTFSNQTKTKIICLDNDAKACYDRLSIILTSLITRNFGVPRNCCNLLAETLLRMQYRISTAHGLANTTYGTTLTNTLQGTGQGQALSGAIWTAHHSVISDCFEEEAHGAWLLDPHGKLPTKITHTGFVDDNDVNTNHNLTVKKPTPEEIWACITTIKNKALIKAATKDAQLWTNLLHAAAQKLSLEKSFAIRLQHVFDSTGEPTATNISNTVFPIDITDPETNETNPIRAHHCREGYRTLGVWIAPNQTQEQMIEILSERNKKFILKVEKTPLPRRETLIAHTICYVSAMTYPIITACVDNKTIIKIHNKALRTFLPRMGLNPNFPRAALFAPKQVGGLQIPSLTTSASSQRITRLITNMANGTTTSRLLQITLQWQQLLSGITTAFLTSTRRLAYLEPTWWTQMRGHLTAQNTKIIFPHVTLPQPARQHDQAIMEIAEDQQPKPQPSHLRAINRVRLYYQIVMLSDITTHDGSKIYKDYYDASRPDHHRKSNMNWPIQPKPGPLHFTYWKAFLHKLTTKNHGPLKHPLGSWILDHKQPEWNTYWSPTQKAAYIRTNKDWHRHSIASQYNNTFHCQKLGQPTTNLPPDIIPANARNPIPGKITIDVSTRTTTPDSPPWYEKLVPPTKLFITTTTNFATDGSYKNNHGSYAWTLSNPTNQTTHSGTTPGTHGHITARRSEATALLSVLLFLQHNTSAPNEQRPIVLIYCDNHRVLTSIQNPPTEPLYNDYDIINQAHQTLKKAQEKFDIRIHHISPKQPTPIDPDIYSLHQIAHDTASQQRITQPDEHFFIEMPDSPGYIVVHNQYLTNNVPQQLKTLHHETTYRKYLTDRYKWPPELHNKIDWVTLAEATKTLSTQDKITMTKIRHDWAPTNQRLHRMKISSSPNCPFCLDPETLAHVYTCQNRQQRQTRTEEFDAFKKKIMTDAGIPPALIAIIHHYTQTQQPTIPISLNTDAMLHQDAIGNDLFRAGLIATPLLNNIVDYEPNAQKQQKLKTVIVRSILALTIQRWKRRCVDSHEDILLKRKNTFQQIKDFYESYPLLPTPFQFLKQTSLSDWIFKPVSQMEAWIDNMKTLETAIKTAWDRDTRSKITKYFKSRKNQTKTHTKTKINRQKPKNKKTMTQQKIHTTHEPNVLHIAKPLEPMPEARKPPDPCTDEHACT